jgi:hypothetical protein
VEAGVSIIPDDPMLTGAMEMAKELNMSQEGFDSLVNHYGKMQLFEHQAAEDNKLAEFKSLGNNAQHRVNGINNWITANLDEETGEGLRGLVDSAAGVKAVEALIQKTRNAPVAPDHVEAAHYMSVSELKNMYFERYVNGNRKINNDPAFREQYNKMAQNVYGTGEHRETIGAKG